MALLLLTGSDQAIFPMSVITTVGFTAFTRIYRDTHHHEDILRENLTLCGPSSRAITLVAMSIPALEVPTTSHSGEIQNHF